ncbi:MAG: hypothetical protein EOS82_32295 [Mesorhizobium sp.]|uniref:hypothetical protein n=1 Tax=Mesorhizobium sp. TaxID=1871066 RepID=UPI000FE4D0BA|nr:hypothetical protein [Mesorhizobium sp.]RWQ39717.1 MAG: hypothetical protein EOS82_32295 [Mesorhizobium sp.]
MTTIASAGINLDDDDLNDIDINLDTSVILDILDDITINLDTTSVTLDDLDDITINLLLTKRA